MMTIELDDEEIRGVHGSLENYLNHLRVEIAHTDRRDFREALKKREALIEGVIRRLMEAAIQSAA